MEKKRIVVTGGAGFIGSHLCEKLINSGNEVICIDNLFTGQIENINHLISCDSFKFIHQDVTDEIDVECDQIYNLACPASPVHYQYDCIRTGKTSVLGALNVLELAKYNAAKVLQASTSEVYGDPKEHPQTEGYWGNVNPIGIRSCYDEGKRMAETFFFDYHRVYNTDIKIVRIFNTYGPKMRCDDGRVVSNFIVQALKGEDITVYGDGKQTRSFCYVDDLVNGLIKMMNSGGDITGPINLGNPEEYSMNQVADMIIDATNSNSKIIYKDLPKDDPTKRKPNINLAKEKLGWSPIVDFSQGLNKTIDYFKSVI